MTRPQMLIALGFIVALSPFSGLPTTWLEFLLPAVGILVIALGYSFAPKKEKSVAQTPEQSLSQ